jgi:hypothetical protein
MNTPSLGKPMGTDLPLPGDRNPGQAAYHHLLNRFTWALILWTTAWLIVLCMKGAVLMYGAPASVNEAAYWLSWVSYPPAALELLVSAILLAVFRPHNNADRSVRYAPPQRLQRTRWALYGLIVTPLALVWIA